MSRVILNETRCDFIFENKIFSNRGAYVDENFANVYVKKTINNQIEVTDWKGNTLGHGIITNEWHKWHTYAGKVIYRHVNFKINNITYSGRYSPSSGELIRAKRLYFKKQGQKP